MLLKVLMFNSFVKTQPDLLLQTGPVAQVLSSQQPV